MSNPSIEGDIGPSQNCEDDLSWKIVDTDYHLFKLHNKLVETLNSLVTVSSEAMFFNLISFFSRMITWIDYYLDRFCHINHQGHF